MKKIYIAHPLRGDCPTKDNVWKNIRSVTEICKKIKEEHPDALILSPIHAFSFEPVDASDEWVFSQCRELLSLADELWVFGDWKTSKGCRMEMNYAAKRNIPLFINGVWVSKP